MSYRVVNTTTGEIAAMFPDEKQYEELAKKACDNCAKATPGYWAVLHVVEIHKSDTRSKNK